MSIGYTTGIPSGPHSPSADQPNMMTNNDNIPIYVAVDHVGFGVGDGQTSGRHKQVTFDSNNTPSVPTTTPVLFTADPGGAPLNYPQLYFYSGTAAQGEDQYNLTGTAGSTGSGGSTFLFGGLIVKWGFIANAPDNTPIAFSTLSGAAFPNNCYGVFPIINKNNTSSPVNVTISSFTASNFTLRISFQSGGTTSQNILYYAIGN